MANFKSIASDTLGGSEVIKGREKISTDDIIRTYPDGITVTEFDIIPKAGGNSYAVCAFAEDEHKYFNGGALMTKIVLAWVKEYNGEVETASAELKESGGVKFNVEKKQTKSGRTITVFTAL